MFGATSGPLVKHETPRVLVESTHTFRRAHAHWKSRLSSTRLSNSPSLACSSVFHIAQAPRFDEHRTRNSLSQR